MHEQLLRIAGASEAPDGVTGQVQLAGDGAQVAALREQLVDEGIPVAGPLGHAPRPPLWTSKLICGWGGDRRRCGHLVRSVGAAAAQGEVIHAQHWGSAVGCGVGQGSDHPDQRHPVHRSGQAAGEPGTGPAAQGQDDRLQQRAERDAVAAVADGQPGHLLGESLRGAVVVAAPEPPYPQVKRHLLVADRAVAHPPLIAAVHALGDRPTPRARRLPGASPGPDPDRPALPAHPVNLQAGQMREENREQLRDRHPA